MKGEQAWGVWWRIASIALAPGLALLAVSLLGAAGRRGVFQADVAALAAAVAVGAFVARLGWLPLLALPAGALLCVPAHLLAGGTWMGSLSLVLLVVAVGAAAAGLAATGRGLGAPWLTAGVAATAVLSVAMTGLLWADAVGDDLPRSRRFAFKQAVVHLDAATACAYDAADFDRFHDPRIYDRVHLASSAVRVPAAGPTGLVWLVLAVLGLLGGRLLGADRRRAPRGPQ